MSNQPNKSRASLGKPVISFGESCLPLSVWLISLKKFPFSCNDGDDVIYARFSDLPVVFADLAWHNSGKGKLFNFLVLQTSSSTNIFCPQNTICQDSSGTPSHNILTVGKLRDKLIVVTEPGDASNRFTQYIYQMPIDSLNKSADELFLTEDPKTLEELWPNLYHDPKYGRLVFENVSLIYNSFTAIDSVSEYYFLTTLWEKAKTTGVVYDIKNGKALKGVVTNNKRNTEVLISSDSLNSFFAVQIGDNKGLTIMRFKFQGKTVVESLNMTDGITPEDQLHAYYPLCQVGADSMMMEKKESLGGEDKNNTSTCEPLKYPLSKGFVSGDKIYLFGQEKIYIFPSSFYDKPNVPVKVITKEYSSFINCHPKVEVKTVKSGMGIGVIIGIVIVVLIIILCCALFCTREVIHHKRRQRHRKKKRHEKKKKIEAAVKEGKPIPKEEKEDTPPAGPMGSILSFFMPTPRSDEGGSFATGGKLSKASKANSTISVGGQVSVRSALETNNSRAGGGSKANQSVLPSEMATSAFSAQKGGGGGGGTTTKAGGGSKAGSKVGGGSKAGGGSKVGDNKAGGSRAYSSSLAPGGGSSVKKDAKKDAKKDGKKDGKKGGDHKKHKAK